MITFNELSPLNYVNTVFSSAESSHPKGIYPFGRARAVNPTVTITLHYVRRQG